MSTSDSDSDVDFDIQAPKGVQVHGRRAAENKREAVVRKKTKPLVPANNYNDEERESSPNRQKKGRKRPPAPSWNDSESSEDRLSLNSDDEQTGTNRNSTSTENQPPGGRPRNVRGIDDDSNDDEPGPAEAERKGGHHRRPRKRLSVRQSDISRAGSTILAVASTAGPPPDAETLKRVYSTCIDLFQSHKITTENAFDLRFLELMGDIIDMPEFDKNDMVGAGRLLEAGAKIYVCRVDKTKNSVMDLASTLNLQQRRKQREDDNHVAGDDMPNNGMDSMAQESSEAVKEKKRKKRSKENQFIADPEKITMSLDDNSATGKARRTALKAKFDDFLDNDCDFDYEESIFAKRKDPVNEEQQVPFGDAEFLVLDVIMNHNEIAEFEHLRFEMLVDYDSKEHDLWGIRLNATVAPELERSVHGDVDHPEPDLLGHNDDHYVPNEEPAVDYSQAALNLEDDRGFDGTFVNDDGIEAENDGTPVVNPLNIGSLEEFYNMYSKIKSKFGWCGPTIFRPQIFPNNANPTQRKPRAKKEISLISYTTTTEWRNSFNAFVTNKPEKCVFDERTVEKWCVGGRRLPPCLGIGDGTDQGDDDDQNMEQVDVDVKANVFTVIPKTFRYFCTPEIHIFEGLPKIEKREGEEFCREEEEYIQDAGFEIERHRDDHSIDDAMLDGHDMDIPLTAETHAPLFDASFTFPISLGGLMMESDAISKASGTDSVKFTKKPKPIDMHALKRAILHFLQEKLQLRADGSPSREEETSTDLATLVKEVCQKVDKKMMEHLSISIIVVGLLHVVVDRKLFMMINKEEPSNPKIISRGSLWNHADNIPLPNFNILDDD